MMNSYSKIAPQVSEDKQKHQVPLQIIQNILAYSLSVEAKKGKQENILVHLN